MDEIISTKNVLREQLIKNKLHNSLGKYSTVDQISNIIKETTGLTFTPIGYAKSFHWVDNESTNTETNDSRFGWCMRKYTDYNDGESHDNKTDIFDIQDAATRVQSDTEDIATRVQGAPQGDTEDTATRVQGAPQGDTEDTAKRVQGAPQGARGCTFGDTEDAAKRVQGAPQGDIIIYEEEISFDDNKIYYSDNYLDLNKQIEEPRYWFWRVIHNRYNNTYTLKRIELGVECTNVKTNVPLRMVLKTLYNRVKKYEAYKLK